MKSVTSDTFPMLATPVADVLRPPGGDPDQGSEFSFERIPGEIDESDAGQMLVVEAGPLASRQRRVFEQLTNL